MDRSRALALLKLSEADAADPSLLRRAYRSRLRQVHPDVNPHERAAELTVSIAKAYRFLLDLPGGAATARADVGGTATSRTQRRRASDGPARSPQTTPPRSSRRRPLTVKVLDESSILVSEDRETTFAALLEAAHSLGEIGYLDRSAWLVEVLVEFVEVPTSSVMMTLHERANRTEVLCTVEPLSGGDSPPIGPVTELVARTIAGIGRARPVS